MNKNSRATPWWKHYPREVALILFGLVAMNLIFVAQAFREGNSVTREAAGQLGDFVGGYIGTLLALVSVVLVDRTLRVQQASVSHDNFESRYFELLKLHRDNVAELQLQGESGRKVFVLLLRELRLLMPLVQQVATRLEITLDQQQLIHVSHYCLFYGSGPNSSRMLKAALSAFPSTFIDAVENEMNNPDLKRSVQKKRQLPYIPFEGHQSRLGHYYRHLYQTVKYVDTHAAQQNRYEYVKTVRAQLSTHEQALLLVNSLTPMGKAWWEGGFMVKYRMVQNLPREFFEPTTEFDVGSLFDAGYFEWEELSH